MWNLEQSLEFISQIHSLAFKLGYNLSLAGGVMVKGYSEKDLDILAIRRPQVIFKHNEVKLIKDSLNKSIIKQDFKLIKIDEDIPFRVVYKYQHKEFKSKNIDLIFIDLPGQTHPYYHRTDVDGSWEKEHLKVLNDNCSNRAST